MASRSHMWPCAILIGLDTMQGIQTARILNNRGVPVIALAQNAEHPHCKTRVCQEILTANTCQEGLVSTLEQIGKRLTQKAVLVPCQDANVHIVSCHREHLKQWYHIPLPDPAVVDLLMDKAQFYTYAQQKELPLPPTFLLRNRLDAEQAAKELTFPAVLKPAVRSAKWVHNTPQKAFKVFTKEKFLSTYDQCRSWAEILIAQQWIQGPESNLFSCNTYFNAQSEPMVTFVARKLRQWPPETGQSSLGQECRNDIVLQETIRLFQGLQYRGLGYLEMKRDIITGKHFIVEPNIGRPTGRSAIAEAGGVELLLTMYCDTLGWPLPPNRQQHYKNVKWVHLRRDFQTSLCAWKQGDLTIGEWWRSLHGQKTYALFSWHDLAPFLSDLAQTARLSLSFLKRNKKNLPFSITTSEVRP